MRYFVLDRPILTVEENGADKAVSLREFIRGAHRFSNFNGNYLERYAVLRFISAMVMDALPMKTAEDRRKVFQAGRFDPAAFEKYFTDCEKEGTVFDLFDDENPFMQCAQGMQGVKEKPAASIDLTEAYGNANSFCCKNGGVLHYAVENERKYTPPEAFRAMLARQCFCGAQIEGPAGINNLPLYIYTIGNNLFETILLHTLSEEESDPQREYGRGTAAWRKRKSEENSTNRTRTQATMLEALTWEPRRIQFIYTGIDNIERVKLADGLKIEYGRYTDTNSLRMRLKKNDQIVNVKPDIKREVWIQAVQALADREEKTYLTPDALKHLFTVYGDNKPENITFAFCGLDKETKNYILRGIVYEELTFPRRVYETQENANTIMEDMKLIADVLSTTELWIKAIVDEPAAYADHLKGKGLSFKQKAHPVAEGTIRFMTGKMRDVIEDKCYMDLLERKSEQEHMENVCEAVRDVVYQGIEYMHSQMGVSVQETERACIAEKKIRSGMNYKIKERKGEIKDDGKDENAGEDLESGEADNE